MKEAFTVERYWFRWGLILLCWLAIGLFFAGRNIVSFLSRGVPIAWAEGVLFQIIYYLVWGLFTPLIFWIAKRYEILRQQKRSIQIQRGVILLAFGLVVAPLQMVLDFVSATLVGRFLLNFSTERILQVYRNMPRFVLIESFTGLATYALIVGVYYAYGYYRRFREREMRAAQLEGQLAHAQLENLKMQLHPHFLFNTLHAISVLMHDDKEAANSMLVRLSELLRATLDSAATQETTLKQELELLQPYLDIEQIRFSDRCQVELKIDPVTLDARVPSLILQPLVENAMRHGVAHCVGRGIVEISAVREGDKLRLKVRDNGPGLRGNVQAALRRGLGLTNSLMRLSQLYGNDASLEICNASENGILLQPSDGGVLVEVLIPFQHLQSEDLK